MHCLHCGKPLAFLSRLRYQRYCSEAHHQQYLKHQEKHAFEELIQTGRGPAGEGEETTAEAVTNEAVAADAVSTGAVLEATPKLPSTPAADEIPEPPPELPLAEQTTEGYAHFLSIVDAERHYYQTILESLPAGVAIFLEDGSLAYCNRAFRRMLDDGSADIYERTLNDLFDHEGVQAAVAQTLMGEIEGREIVMKNLAEAQGVSLFVSVSALTANDGNLGPQVIVFLNVLPAAEATEG